MIDLNAIAKQVDELQAIYSTFVGYSMPLTLSVREGWERWLFAGFTRSDLELVLRYWQKQIAKGMSPGSVRFSRLIRDTERFAEDLCLAHIDKNGCKSATPRERALRELRPQACEPVNGEAAKHGREVALKALENLRREIGGN